MSKFEVGQEVIFTHGDLKDVMGVVVVPHFQLSRSDWPEVLVEYEGHRRFFVDFDDVRPAEDPYEYNIERTSGVTDKTYLYFGQDGWDDNRKSVEQEYNELLAADSTRLMNNKYRFVKRRKAGRIQDV